MILNGRITIIRLLLLLLLLTSMHNMRDDSLLDTLDLLTLLEFVFVLLTELDVGTVVCAGESLAKSGAVGSRCSGCS
jgi:hypothetical protein